MVKGISRQIIMVHPPETDLFDQAIFILSDKAQESGGITDEEILQQARRAADGYLRGKLRGGRGDKRRPGRWLCAILGAAGMAAVWLLTALLW